jgi:oligogalacturonide lyase
MIGDRWKSEIREFKDGKTGRAIQQLTTIGNNVHLYFTENSFDLRKREIIFRSDRASGESRAPHESPHYDLFRMNLDSGEIEQLTDEPETVDASGNVTKTPDSQLIVYHTGKKLKLLDTTTGKISVVYAETGNFTVRAPSIAPNRRYLAFARNEDVRIPRGPNYSGFKESFYRIKDGRITLAYLDGSGWFDVFKDTHWTAHFQFC